PNSHASHMKLTRHFDTVSMRSGRQMACVVVALQRPPWRLLRLDPLGNGGVLDGNTGDRDGADAEEVAKGGLYHPTMCHDHDGLALVLLLDPMQRDMRPR